MPSEPGAGTSQGLVAEGAGRFREVFAQAGYDEAGLVDTLGPIQLPRRLGRDRAHFRHLTRRGRTLDALIRLFLLGIPEDLEAARRALAPDPPEEWARVGLVAIEGDQVRGLVRMMAFRSLLVASDHQETPDSAERHDQVMGMTASTVVLADSTLRRPVGSTLDLGTGSGVQAFLAAAHSDRVWATDSNARAIEFARFNAAFNGCAERIEFLEGDAFDPVRGRTFDLIVSNPPFALTPSRRFLYRDSGVPLDGFARSLIQDGARCLNEGGFCQIVCDWAHIEGQDWKERLAGWFDGAGCDAWVMRTDTHDAADYAHVWIRDTEQAGVEESARLYDEWLAYYARERIEATSTGLIALRKASGRRNWLRIEEGPAGNSGPFGEYVLRGFGLRDFLEAASDDAALLGGKFRVAESARLDHVCEWEDGSWRIRSAKIRLAQGLQYESDIDLRLAGMVALCDGRHTLGEILEKTAVTLREDLQRITPNCLALMRQLIERGFLIPAG
ncbi:MAG: methyltransferase [Bryobacteraceae bacterium]|jgi:methylase of polypeptide subunit release factors